MIDASSLDGARCLITGGAGYLGTQLAKALCARGCDVVSLDAAAPTTEVPGVRAVRADLRDAAAVDAALVGVDVVFHTAAVIELARYAPAPVKALVHAVNVDATESLLRRAQAAGVGRFVHTSSTATVMLEGRGGDDESLPYSSYPNLYTTTKVAAEKLVRGHVGTMRTVSLRPGGIYGPGERKQLVGPSFEAFARGEPLTILGDGTSRLDYTHVDNLVDAHLRAAVALGGAGVAAGKAYFISDGQPVNHGEFTRRMVAQLGLVPKLRYVPVGAIHAFAAVAERAYERFGRKPVVSMGQVVTCAHDFWFSIDAARRDLGYVPTYDTDAGLATMVPDLLDYLRASGFRGR